MRTYTGVSRLFNSNFVIRAPAMASSGSDADGGVDVHVVVLNAERLVPLLLLLLLLSTQRRSAMLLPLLLLTVMATHPSCGRCRT